MANYTYRSSKGSPLTNTEIDGNFQLTEKTLNVSLSLNITGTYTLTQDEADSKTLVVYTSTNPGYIILPTLKVGKFVIQNRTLSALVYVKSTTQTGNIAIYPGSTSTIIHDGFTCVQADPTVGAFPAGTRLLFSQTTAPVGWAQDTAMDDRMLRVVGNTGGGNTGGTDSPTVMNVVPSHTHTFSGSAMASHTHIFTGAALLGHTHPVMAHDHVVHSQMLDTSFISNGSTEILSATGSTFTTGQTGGTTDNASAGTPSGTNSSVSAGIPTGSISTNSGAANWAPKYLNVIVCVKQ
jgi:hypothetical protein